MSEQELVVRETTEKGSKHNSISRRDFLKLSATVGTVAALSDFTLGGPIKTLVQGATPQQGAVQEDVWIPTACWMCGLGGECGILAHRVNGVVVKFEGDPRHPGSLGKICGRGQAGHMKLYNPYMVKAPLKRTNPEKGRGVDPKWVEISWDEALNTVAGKLKAIKDGDNPKKFLLMSGWGQRETAGTFTTPFSSKWGFQSVISGPGGMSCAAAVHDTGYIQNGTYLTPGSDMNYSNFVISVGNDYGGNKAGPGQARDGKEARERGMRMVYVDTRLSPEANKWDEWIPIRGHTDLAFYLALSNVLLYELNVYDVDFIKNRSNGPYLISVDNGLYVRSKTDIMRPDASRKLQTLGKPLIWDPLDQKAKVFDDKTIKDMALEGGPYNVDGVNCKPGFQLVKEHIKDYTPEWAEKITTVPAATIRRLTKTLADEAKIGSTIVIEGFTFPYRPVAVTVGRGAQTHKQATRIVLASLLPNYLLGAAEVPGCAVDIAGSGMPTAFPAYTSGPDGTNLPQGTASYRTIIKPTYNMDWTYYPCSYKSYFATWPALLNPQKYGIDFNLEVLGIYGANPIFGWGSGDAVTEAMKKIPFIYSQSYHFDEPTEMADIVLPEPGYPGWLNFNHTMLRQPLLKTPQYNTKYPEDIDIEIAARIGPDVLDAFNSSITRPCKPAYKTKAGVKYTWEQLLDMQLKSAYGDQYGLEWFKANGYPPVTTPTSVSSHYGYYRNPKNKTHLYVEYITWAKEELKKDLKTLGLTHPDPTWDTDYISMPDYRPNPSYTAPPEYDLFETNFRPFLMSMGFSPDNPWTMEAMAHFDPYTMNVWLNRATGEAKGLKDGDAVWVESATKEPWAKVKGNVKLSECVHTESCVIGGQWGRWAVGMNPVAKLGPHHNSLTSSVNPAYCENFSGNVDMGAKVKIYKV